LFFTLFFSLSAIQLARQSETIRISSLPPLSAQFSANFTKSAVHQNFAFSVGKFTL
jgi:hypothetical protein